MRSPAIRILLMLCVMAPAGGHCAAAGGSRASVTLEVLTQPGLPLDASQRWYRALTRLGVTGLQIRQAGPRDKASITDRGTKAAPSYRVVGILSGDNVLHLAGGSFRLDDTARLRKWLDALRADGPEGVTARRSAFGLLPSQLQAVTSDLRRPVAFATKNIAAAEAVRRLAGQLQYPMVADANDSRALGEVTLEDELRGMSAGTALAIMLRPAGLVFLPERTSGGDLQYRVRRGARGAESWPVGWKPEKRPYDVLPVLFEFLNVEISDIPVSEAVEAIGARLKVPLAYDRNAMAVHGVDPTQLPASVPDGRMSYSQTLRRVLSQAKMQYDLRLDEAEKPFLWLTTVKPVR